MFDKCKHRANNFIAWALCLLWLVSCSPTNIQVPGETHRSETTPTTTLADTLKELPATRVRTTEPLPATNTPVMSTTKTSIATFAFMQKDAAIPSCVNYTNPSPVSSLKGIDGFIYYSTNNLDHLLVLSGVPLQSTPIDLPVEKADFFTISDDEEWLLAYARAPEPLDKGIQYPFFLISKKGEVDERKLDLSQMTDVAGQNLQFANFLYWNMEWLTNSIIKVRGAYGESPQAIFPILVYQYYDVEQDIWLNEPFQSLPDRKPYQWVDLSPDLTRVLYLTENRNFVLWDTKNNQKLWANFLGTSQLPPYAQWSPNDQKVAFWTDGLPFSVQLLDHDGNGYQQIQNPVYEDVEDEFQPYRGFFAWSPDSRYLVMSGIVFNRQTKLRTAIFYIYDTEESTFTYRCPLGDTSDKTVSSDMLWSADGRFVVTKFPQSNTVPFRIYDLEDRQVYQVESSGFAAIEWVKSFSLKH